MMKALTLPLLNGRANNEVSTPHSVKNRISVRMTAVRRAFVSIRTARRRSYSAASAMPKTIDHRK